VYTQSVIFRLKLTVQNPPARLPEVLVAPRPRINVQSSEPFWRTRAPSAKLVIALPATSCFFTWPFLMCLESTALLAMSVDPIFDAAYAEAAVKGIVRMHLRWCAENPGIARFLVTVSEPAVLEAAEAELKGGNERFAAIVRNWWRPHAHYGSLRPLTAAQSLALWLGPAQEWIRAWLLGAFAESPSDEDAELLADAAWLCLRAND
jgi:hypothetical protein